MASRVIIWLRDDEAEELQQRAEAMGMKHYELAILLTCKWLGQKVPTKPKARRKWLDRHEALTREEYATRGGSTLQRCLVILAEGPKSTLEIRKALGWKSTGGLTEVLNGTDKIERCPPPESYAKARGRTPHFWRLVGSSS